MARSPGTDGLRAFLLSEAKMSEQSSVEEMGIVITEELTW